MLRLFIFILIFFTISSSFAQNADSLKKHDDYNFGFEKMKTGNKLPLGWSGSSKVSGYRVEADTVEKHSGNRSLLMEKTDLTNKTDYAMSVYGLPAKYEGKEIELSAYIKFSDVSKFVNLILRIDDEDGDILQFASLEKQKIRGTKDWQKYSIKLPLPEDARFIRIWPMLSGTGKLWIDDVEVLIDGKSLDQAKIKTDYNPNAVKSLPYGGNAATGGKVKVKDAEIYYEIYGKGEPLLLLHGNSQSISAFKKQIKSFEKEYKVIAVDTRGQGKSTDLSTGALSYNLFAEDMKTLLDSLHISKTNILGWSDGGNTGLIMAFKYPSYVNKLAVMGANAFATDQAVPASVLSEVQMAIDGLKTKSDEGSKKQVRLFTMLLNEPHISAENLQSIKAPVLVMAGEKDMILEKHTQYIAGQIPKGQLQIFKGATHYAPVEIVAEFNERVLKFLRE